MPFDKQRYIESIGNYLKNRQQFSLDEIDKHRGRWIAWNPDGTQIIASAVELEDLEVMLAAVGDDAIYCTVEGIPDRDTILGSSGCIAEEDP
jgi:hypothetical protein